jgi:hypothetical protein
MPAPTPASKVDVDPNFERQLRKIKDDARAASEALRSGGQVKWMRPHDWEGDPTDYESIHEALNRDRANEQFVDAVKDAQAPGVVGDTISATLMIDYLATMERAFKNRATMSHCRRIAHVAGRKKGHGSDTGPLVQSSLEYLRRVVRKAKGPQ